MIARPRLSAGQLLGRQGLKRLLYSQLSLRSALHVARGSEAPLQSFTVENDPPSLYFNFRLDDEKLQAFARRFVLPRGLTLTPIRCLEGAQARYVLTLNVYRVSGLVNALRAEWSTYVCDAAGKPRYLILEARSSRPSLDPVALFTRAHAVVHVLSNGRLDSTISATEGVFRASVPTPDARTMERVTISREWVEANDYIYWLNGVADRVFYGGSLVNPRVVSIAVSHADVRDDTFFGQFVAAEAPIEIVAFLDPIELVISPWHNL
jgi:hypothetical protein